MVSTGKGTHVSGTEPVSINVSSFFLFALHSLKSDFKMIGSITFLMLQFHYQRTLLNQHPRSLISPKPLPSTDTKLRQYTLFPVIERDMALE